MLNWLLEEDEPSARYHTLVDLQERSQNDQRVASTRNRIGKVGWASKILAKQKENTYWDNPKSCYVPKFSACSWQLVVLADLGLTSKDPRVGKAVDHLLELHNVDSGGISLRPTGNAKFEPHICATGNMVRALAKMGYAEDHRVLRAMDWLLSKQLADGGWNCSPEQPPPAGPASVTRLTAKTSETPSPASDGTAGRGTDLKLSCTLLQLSEKPVRCAPLFFQEKLSPKTLS